MTKSKSKIFICWLKWLFIYFKSFKRDKAGLHFHLAAQSFPKTSFDIPLDTLNTNIIGTAIIRVYKDAWIKNMDSNLFFIWGFGRVPKINYNWWGM